MLQKFVEFKKRMGSPVRLDRRAPKKEIRMKKTVCGIFVAVAFICAGMAAYGAVDPTKTSYTPKEMELRTTAREIFSQNLTWQRAVALTTIGSAGDASKAQERLMRSQDDIGNTFGTYFGDADGQQLASLLKQYAQLVADYSTSAMMHADNSLNVTKMHDTMDQIGTFLSQENMVWDKTRLSDKLKKYSDMLTAEIDLQGKSFGTIDSTTCDATFYQAMDIADTFAFGIIKQNPGKFW